MATGSVPITAGSGTPIRTITNSSVDSGAFQQVMSFAGPDGTLAPFDPDGTLQVSPEPTTLLVDDYSLAITTYHTTGGTAPTIANGSGATAEGTTASATSYLRSTLPYYLRAATYLRIAHIVNFEATATANNTRWWGYGQNQATPTSAAPVLNGAVFILDAANNGALSAAYFSNGTKVTVAWKTGVTVTRDALPHRYQIDYRQSRIDWSIDGAVVATQLFPQLAVAQGMYEIWGAANAATAPSAHTFGVSSSSVADLGGNNRTLSDGVNPGIQATVKAASTAIAATDSPLAVGFHPTSPLPSGSNSIGVVGLNGSTNFIGAVAVGAATPSASYYTSTTTNAATVAKNGAGALQALVISNNSGSTQWVKIYNAGSVTLGTTAAVMDVQVAAGATFSLATGPNGVRMTAGISYAVTGATGATNNTAGAGSVLVTVTYI